MKKNSVFFKIDKLAEKNYFDYFLSKNNVFGEEMQETVYQQHPGFKSSNDISSYIAEYYRAHLSEIHEYAIALSKSWKSKEKQVFSGLLNQINLPPDYKIDAVCFVGIVGIYPRNIDNNTMHIYYRDTIQESEATVLHELTHFLFFEKWAHVFPEDKKLFGVTSPIWHLSEILAPIFNADPKILQYFPCAVTKSYRDYDEKHPNHEVSIFDFFKTSYLESVSKGEPIEKYLEFARREAMGLYSGVQEK